MNSELQPHPRMRLNPKEVLRWLLVPVAAVGGFVLSIFLFLPVRRLLEFLMDRFGYDDMPTKDSFMYVFLPASGALAAALVILLGAWAAPRLRMTIALCLFFVGGVFAWLWVGNFHSWQFSPHGPIRVWHPIIGTYTGGVIACVSVYFIFRKAKTPGRAEPEDNEDVIIDTR